MRTLLLISLTMILTPSRALADDHLDAAQAEIVALMTRCFDAWVDANEHDEFARFTQACPHADDAQYWYLPSPDLIALHDLFAHGTNEAYGWRDMQPLRVQINDDLALVYYRITWLFTTPQRDNGTNTSARLTVLRKEGGRWLHAGGSITALEGPG